MAGSCREDEGGERERCDPTSCSSSILLPFYKKIKLSTCAGPPPSSSQPSPQTAVDAAVETEELVQEEEEEEGGEEYEFEIESEGDESENGDNNDEDDGDDDDQGEEEFEDHQPQPEVKEEAIRGKLISVEMDSDVLDCPICLEVLSIPVFQCGNGHIACASCCLKVRKKCPSCSLSIGYNRCRAIENVLESLKVSCRNMNYGCTLMVKYLHKHEHEDACICWPCSCPVLDCNYVGNYRKVYEHYGDRHSTSADKVFTFDNLFSVSLEKSQRFVVLREVSEGIIFILSHFSELCGSALSVVHLGPPRSGLQCVYELTARDGKTSISLQSSVETTQKFVDTPPAKMFLLIPSYYTGTCGQLKLDVCIRYYFAGRTGSIFMSWFAHWSDTAPSQGGGLLFYLR